MPPVEVSVTIAGLGAARGEVARALLCAAESLGLAPGVVVSTSEGYRVPPEVAYAAGILPAPAPTRRPVGRPRKTPVIEPVEIVEES